MNNLRRYSWLLLVLLSMAPLWLVSLFGRTYWTPDEPREAAISWRMSTHGNYVLPELGARQFLEKPPLSYWLSAASFTAFGQSPAAARVPNLFYLLVTTIAVGLLVNAMAGPGAGMMAGLISASAFESYRVAIWLAPDACLMAGCALALLGAYRGYGAMQSRDKLWWYSLMHLGALWAFMAKSAVGWLVPALALLTLIIWERRWRELACWPLWAGFALQVLGIGAWVAAVWHRPDGIDALRVLFWNNLAGRFTHIGATGALDYASAHQNWLGKYLTELPYYLFPWFLLVVAALRRAWTATRGATTLNTAWRFAIAAWVPFFVVISCAATARDVYFAPAIIGISALIALWVDDAATRRDRLDQWMLRGTRYMTGLLVLIMGLALMLLGLTEATSDTQLMLLALGITLLVAVSVVGFRRSATAQRRQVPAVSVAWCYLITVVTLFIGGLTISPVVNRWQNLGSVAQAVQRDVAGQPLAVLNPDETTLAVLDYYLPGTSVTELSTDEQTPTQTITTWFAQQPAQSRVLVLLPGHAPGALTHWLARFKPQRSPGDGVVADIVSANAARIVARYDIPQGRRFALLGPIQPVTNNHAVNVTLAAPVVPSATATTLR